MKQEAFFRRTVVRAALLAAIVVSLPALVPAGAFADAPPALSVGLNPVKTNGVLTAYTVTANLSAPSPYDCTQSNPPTYPDLSFTQDPTQDPAGSNDAFTSPLSNPVSDTPATSCDTASWTTDPGAPFGITGADNATRFSPGVWAAEQRRGRRWAPSAMGGWRSPRR